MDDEKLEKLSILPDSVASLYPSASAWACPFCGIAITHKGHVLTCLERKFTCHRKNCGQEVRVSDKNIHALECLSYTCPYNTCEHNKDAVWMSAIDNIKHQKKHKLHGVVEEEKEIEEEEHSEFDPDDDDEYYGEEDSIIEYTDDEYSE
jgi:hypothetical protein